MTINVKREMIQYLKIISKNSNLIVSMSCRMFLQKSAGTSWGLAWSLLQPLSVIIVFWVVFAYGLKVQSPIDSPFILWFICGLAPWFMFSETVISSTNSIQNNVNLIKKTLFPSELLPIICCVSNFFTHLIFLGILAILIISMGSILSAKSLLFLYYSIALVLFCVGVSLATAAIQPYFKDTTQIVSILLNILFWFTPIVWPKNIVPESYVFIYDFNPIYYIIEGYRSSLLENNLPEILNFQTIYFWAITLFMLNFGYKFFYRLKKYFADLV